MAVLKARNRYEELYIYNYHIIYIKTIDKGLRRAKRATAVMHINKRAITITVNVFNLNRG